VLGVFGVWGKCPKNLRKMNYLDSFIILLKFKNIILQLKI
jgi:hypothetical protein